MNTNDLSLDLTLGDYVYSIPFKNLLINVTYNNRADCDLMVAMLKQEVAADGVTLADMNDIRLGDPFFAAFFPVFDIDNDQIGLAKSIRAQTGVAKTAVVTPTPEEFTQ